MCISMVSCLRRVSNEMAYREAFDLKKLIEKIPGKDVAIKTLLDFAKKIGKGKVLQILDAVVKDKSIKQAEMGSSIVRKFGYPILVAASIFIAMLGKNAVEDAMNKLEKMTETRTQQIMDVGIE